MANILHWSGDGDYPSEVVGESHYQKDLKRLAGGERRKQTKARLICEANNEYDPKAVRVEIGGKTIGHLSREDARAHRRKLEALKKAGAIVEAPAVIVTGNEGVCGVYLDVPEGGQISIDTRPFVRRHFVLLAAVAVILLLSGAGSPIGLVLAAYLVYFRLKRWQP